jgi:hypothetical protein
MSKTLPYKLKELNELIKQSNYERDHIKESDHARKVHFIKVEGVEIY